ncbi:hypothetical protein [Haladaptatus caseinilyticus]|uniref:hypothetical protein n=1 Tax=Haladaptatus caseinilyticus TaxID=2993314 RepID=UPI00224B7169|nr:hypothetical protein [Haladaptatus caseinilyticus]
MERTNRGTDASSGRLESLIRRLRRGDTVTVGTDTGSFREPRSFIVDRIAEERSARDDDVYYRVHLRGPRGGHYVMMPEKPQGKGAHEPPELFYQHPDDHDKWGDPEEETEASFT